MFLPPSLFVFCFFALFIFSVATVRAANEPMVIDINGGVEEVPFEVGDADPQVTPNFVESIEASKLQGPAFDLAHVIENTNGIQLRKNGGIGSFTSISIRGKSADQVTVYLDGMPINNASGGSVDLSRIPINQIARIDIYKDSFPAEFSEVANGGVINIITHRSTKQKLNLSVSAGSFNTTQTDFNTTFSHRGWQIISSGGYLESKNNFTFNFENNTFLNPNDDEIQQRYNNELYRLNFFGKAIHQLNDTASVYFQSEYFDKKKNIPTIYNSPGAKSTLIDLNTDFSVGYKDRAFLFSNLSSSFVAKVAKKQTEFIDKLGDIVLSPMINKQIHNNIEAKVYLKYTSNNYELTTSNTIRYENLTVIDNIKNKIVRENYRYLLSSSLGVRYFILDRKIILSSVLRTISSIDQYLGETESTLGTVSVLDFNKKYQTFSPQIGVQYQLSPDLRFASNLSKYFRLPNYVELFGTRGFIGSSEDLLPEEGVNFDVGFRYLKYIQSNTLTQFSWDMAFFRSLLKNEIMYVFSARGAGKPTNIGSSTITGLENTFSVEFNYNILFTSSTTLQAPINTSNKNNLLPGRSFWFQNTRVQITENRYTSYLEHNAKSIYYLDSNQDIPSDETSVFNAGLEAKFKKATFSLTLNNIFNQQIKDYFFQPMSGRNIFLTTKYNFI